MLRNKNVSLSDFALDPSRLSTLSSSLAMFDPLTGYTQGAFNLANDPLLRQPQQGQQQQQQRQQQQRQQQQQQQQQQQRPSFLVDDDMDTFGSIRNNRVMGTYPDDFYDPDNDGYGGR
jgi:hypothetical protein